MSLTIKVLIGLIGGLLAGFGIGASGMAWLETAAQWIEPLGRLWVNAIRMTVIPLVGSLLVGFSFAKALAYSMGIPWIGINHLEGHINSVFLEPDPPPFPFVALLVSGGHTALYHVTSHTHIELMGQTRDFR